MFCVGGMRRFPLVHAFSPALVDHAFGVTHDTVIMLCTHRLEQFKARDTRSARPVEHDFHVFDFLARNLQRIQKTRCTDHGCPVLIVVENGDIHFLF